MKQQDEVTVPVPDNNNDILLGIGIALVGGYLFVSQVLPRIMPEDVEEQVIPAKIAQPYDFVYEDRFPDFYPYQSFANPARRPYFGGLPVPVPIESIYVPPPTLGYWNPAYPNTDNIK